MMIYYLLLLKASDEYLHLWNWVKIINSIVLNKERTYLLIDCFVLTYDYRWKGTNGNDEIRTQLDLKGNLLSN